VWILFTSLKTDRELTTLPITYLPRDPTLANYFRAFADQPLATFFMNSVIVAVITLLLSWA
jgi:multiple sugar transport system permease protein